VVSKKQSKESAANILDSSCMDCGCDTFSKNERYALEDNLWRFVNPLVIRMLRPTVAWVV
jgi:hypothetical protein